MTSGRVVVGVGVTTEGAVGKVGRLVATGNAVDEGALGIWSTEAEVRTGSSTPPEAVTAGTEAARVEDSTETLSEAVV